MREVWRDVIDSCLQEKRGMFGKVGMNKGDRVVWMEV